MDFFHLEVGNAVAQQSSYPVVLFKQRDSMTDPCELLSRCHARRARAHDGDFFTGLVFGHLRLDPAFSPGAVDDGVFDRLDAYRVVIDIERAGGLARRRANSAGKFRKIIGAVQRIDRVFPVGAKYHVVEVRNDVVDRTTTVAKRGAAVHAARSLLVGLRIIQTDDEFLVVLQALGDGLVALFQSLIFHETGNFSHDQS